MKRTISNAQGPEPGAAGLGPCAVWCVSRTLRHGRPAFGRHGHQPGPRQRPHPAVHGSVLHIATAYDDMGRVATVTSYADVAGTSPVNQVEYVYNGWGTVDSEYQEPNGLVGPISTTTSVYVQYDYDDGSYTDPKGATAASYLRLDSAWYPANPNGGGSNFVNYLYSLDPSDGTIDNMMSRVDDIETTGVNDLMFRYLGAGTIATEDLSDLDIELDYSATSSTSTATNFGTWDRFGRVRDQLWASYGSEWSALGPPTPTRTTSPIPTTGKAT